MEAIKSGDVPKLPRGKLVTQTEMSKWWKDFTTYQKCHRETLTLTDRGISGLLLGNGLGNILDYGLGNRLGNGLGNILDYGLVNRLGNGLGNGFGNGLVSKKFISITTIIN